MSPRTGFSLASALSIALLVGCPKAPPNTRPDAVTGPLTQEQRLRRDVDALRDQAKALLRTQDEIVWKNWTEGAPLDLTTLEEQAKKLYTPDAIEQIRSLRAATKDPLEARALDELRLHFEGEYLARATATESALASSLLASATFTAGDHEHPVRDLDRLLARERNALKRQELHQGAAAAAPKLVAALEARRARTRAVLQQLGYPTPLAFAAELRRADLDALAKDAEHVLQVTEQPFRNVIDQLATRELRLPVDRVRLRDFPRMFRSRDVDGLFPKDAISQRVEATLDGLGVAPGSLPQLQIDARDLPQKNPLPLALAIEVPTDVRLSVRPLSGLRAQSAYLHEIGHALHASLTREQHFALAKLGVAGVSEAWSQLFELLVEDPVWLDQQAKLGGPRQERYLGASAAWDLYLLRREAARYLFSLALAKDPAADPKALYKAEMEKALLVPVEDEDTALALLEDDEYLASATSLEAAFLAHELQAQLKTRFGPAWWTSKQAGDYLRPLWAHGNALNARELAQAAGANELAPDSLLLRLTSALKLPIAVTVPGE